MLDTIVIDNFFENPDEIRKIALSRSYRDGNENNGRGGWRGQRTLPIRAFEDDICPCCNTVLTSYSEEDQLIVNESKRILDTCIKHYDLEDPHNMAITSYFHITTEETRNSLPYFMQDKFHVDDQGPIAGVVYLHPNPPPNTGTSVLYAEQNQFISLENKYNRLVAYESHRIHALSDVFGDSNETGRLTFTFFTHHKNRIKFFD